MTTKDAAIKDVVAYIKSLGGTCSMSQFFDKFPEDASWLRSELFSSGLVTVDNAKQSISLTKAAEPETGHISFAEYCEKSGCPRELFDQVAPDVVDLIDAYGRVNYMAGKMATLVQMMEAIVSKGKGG